MELTCTHPDFKLWRTEKVWRETCAQCGFTQDPSNRSYDWMAMPDHPLNKRAKRDAKILSALIDSKPWWDCMEYNPRTQKLTFTVE